MVILHVAQSQYHDIGVAKRLGYTVCWIERRQGMKGTGGTIMAPRTEPHYHFASLAAFADAVDAGTIHMVPGALPSRADNPAITL
jgi:putative hydrolase of the HAD superfamily